ncbi:MAG: LysR family transcriptional regulator [Gammaproteobacteria bacterium]|nr:LysR family transcriptional regulator [Gammaproteobacteria bacterium]
MKLPPMNALRAFEAVSRHGSVSRAAEELCVSQGAVSQQLRNLEDFFGKELFHRGANSFTLTEAAESFAAEVQQSLQRIAQAADVIGAAKATHTLRISAPPTLMFKWLMPKLGDFYEIHPGVSVVLDESLQLVTFKNDGFDGAIRFADGEFDKLNFDLLITLKIYAVASPAYIASYGRLESITRPQGHHLIDYYYDSKSISSQHVHWRDIVDGDLAEMEHEHLVYPDGLQSLTAAVHGQGIALVPMYLCEDEVEAGSLVLLSDEVYEYRNRYYFVSPADARPNPALDDFRDWLREISSAHRDAG